MNDCAAGAGCGGASYWRERYSSRTDISDERKLTVTEAVTANREAAVAWDALATHAAKGAAECRHGAELAERTRRRWAR